MRIYIFKSEARTGLRAFAGDPKGSKLRKITDHGQSSASSAWIGLLLISSRVMPSSKQLATPDFNFGALSQMEMRNPRTEKRPILKMLKKFRTGSLRVRKRVAASVVVCHAPTNHPGVDCFPCCGASPLIDRPMTKERQ